MHACLGQQKAILETSYAVARMMQEFQKIESRDDRPWQGHTALTARNAKLLGFSYASLIFNFQKLVSSQL